tara:strand:+ start:272 stop:469 length:198 start_codon:yes stop_codon:yes gene_type:complete
MSNLIDLEISISSVHILQQSGIWDIEDIVTMMDTHTATVTSALSRIKDNDFEEITKAIKKLTLKT